MSQDISHSYESYKLKEYSENQTNNDINKLDVSASDSCPHQNGSLKIIIQQNEAASSFFQYRYLVAFLEFLGFFEINLFRLVTSVSVVAMVNNTAVDFHMASNSTVASCPFNVSNSEENYLPENTGEFDWSPAMQGYVLGAGFLGYVLTQMPGGILAESYGAKFTVVCGLFISSLAHFLSPFAAWSSVYWLIVMQLIRGIGQQTFGQWNKIFAMCIGIAMSSGILFCIFGSADVQPWNYATEEELDKTRSNNKELQETEQPVDAVIHL